MADRASTMQSYAIALPTFDHYLNAPIDNHRVLIKTYLLFPPYDLTPFRHPAYVYIFLNIQSCLFLQLIAATKVTKLQRD